MTQIKPLGDRVLIQRSKAPAKKGNILLPDNAQEKPREGNVVAVGPGKVDDEGKREAMTVRVGDRVLFGAYAGTEVKHLEKEDEYLILSQNDILGILE